jgi:hypothetical protein
MVVLARNCVNWSCVHPEWIAGMAISFIVPVLWLFYGPVGISQVRLGYDYFRAPWHAFSGSLILVVASALGLGCLPWSLRSGWLQRRSFVFWCWCGVILVVLLSFGPLISTPNRDLAIGPYCLLYRIMPGFDGVRVPSRICFLSIPLMVLLAAHGISAVTHGSHVWQRNVLVYGVLLLALVGDLALKPMPPNHVPIGAQIPAAIQWLRDHPEPGAVVAVPPRQFGDPTQLYYATIHRRAILNGYGGFFPSQPMRALAKVREFPAPASLDVLRHRAIRFILVDTQLMQELGRSEFESECDAISELRRVFTQEDSAFIVYELL